MKIQRSIELEKQTTHAAEAIGWFRGKTKSGTVFDFTTDLSLYKGDPEANFSGFIKALPEEFEGNGAIFSFPPAEKDGTHRIAWPKDLVDFNGWNWGYNDSNDPEGGQLASTGVLNITFSRGQTAASGDVVFYSKSGETILEAKFELQQK